MRIHVRWGVLQIWPEGLNLYFLYENGDILNKSNDK